MSLKEEIKKTIIDKERMDLKGLQAVYKTYSDASDLDEESTLDLDDYSFQDQSRDSARNLSLRIEKMKNELDKFINLDFSPKAIVEPGALVLTDSFNFMIGIAVPQFQHNGKTYMGLNVDAPVYGVIAGKKIGDSAEFNGKTYKILEVL